MGPKRLHIKKSLPDYVVADVNNLQAIENSSLRKKALPLQFPLTAEDESDINKLVLKFQNEVAILGLAAPQIGISKRFIVFKVPNEDGDINQTPQETWINPSYEKVDNIMSREFEGCFSVKDVRGPVVRYKKVRYKAFDLNGNLVEGVAENLRARVIQHEVDHLNGILFIDLVPKGFLITKEQSNYDMFD